MALCQIRSGTIRLILLCLLIIQVHGVAQFRQSDAGWYTYVDRIDPGSASTLMAATQRFYQEMVQQHSDYLADGYPEPVMVAGMVVNGQIWLSSSRSYKESEGGRVTTSYPSQSPPQLKAALDECFKNFGPHRRNSNCAEIMLLALYLEETGAPGFPVQVPLAIYGKGVQSGRIGWHHPCTQDGMKNGCEQVVLHTFSFNVLTRRGLLSGAKPKKPAAPGQSAATTKGIGRSIPFKTGRLVPKGQSSSSSRQGKTSSGSSRSPSSSSKSLPGSSNSPTAPRKVCRRDLVDELSLADQLLPRNLDVLNYRGFDDSEMHMLGERDLDDLVYLDSRDVYDFFEPLQTRDFDLDSEHEIRDLLEELYI